MKNYISSGATLSIVAAATLASGAGVLQGSIFGVATGDIANGAEGTINLTGVYELPKVGSQAWTVGALVYWDVSEAHCTTVSTDNVLIGVAAAAVASGAGDVLGQVRLNGVPA
jgi:predicted RecA/RadA family phage recombinase